MKKRIGYIIILLCISIPLIIGTQIYWILNAYTINRVQLENDINQSLASAVQQKQSYNLLHASHVERNAKKGISISGTEDLLGIDLDSLMEHSPGLSKATKGATKPVITITIDADDLPGAEREKGISGLHDVDIEGILRSAYSRELSEEPAIGMAMVDSLFSKELTARGITIGYSLDVESDTSNFTRKSSSLYSRIMPLSILHRHYVRANIPQGPQAVLSRMTTILAVSLLLILIASVSFIYMLKTIIKQKKLSEVKNDFINNMTHELKTPISTVSAALEAMTNFGALNDREKTEKYIHLSKAELNNLTILVEKVLNTSRLEMNKVELAREKIPLQELLDTIIQRHTTSSRKDVRCICEDNCRSITVYADHMHLSNVINNLIDNAIKYNGQIVRIRIACYNDSNFQYISISDNGNGIPKESQTKVFDKFYRVPKGDIHDVKGFGLGLHYVSNIIKQHGGSVSLQSTPGEGSTFTIKLPRYMKRP